MTRISIWTVVKGRSRCWRPTFLPPLLRLPTPLRLPIKLQLRIHNVCGTQDSRVLRFFFAAACACDVILSINGAICQTHFPAPTAPVKMVAAMLILAASALAVAASDAVIGPATPLPHLVLMLTDDLGELHATRLSSPPPVYPPWQSHRPSLWPFPSPAPRGGRRTLIARSPHSPARTACALVTARNAKGSMRLGTETQT